MSDRNNQGSGSSWAWIIGTGVAAVAGTVLAIMAANTETEYTPVPRRRPSALPRPSQQPPQRPSLSASSQEYDFDDASSTSSLGEEVDGQPQKLCTICLRHLDKRPVRELMCGHLYHSYCISMWLENRKDCPVCRRSVLPQ